MPEAFNERRATQIAARYLSKAGGRMREIILVKFMYVTERAALERWGYPLTWDRLCRLPLGPAPSYILNLASGNTLTYDGSRYWSEHIDHVRERGQRREIPWCVLRVPTGADTLPKAALDLIDEVYETYKSVDIVDFVHRLPEHIDPNGSSLPLPYADVLREVGYQDDANERGRELEGIAHIHEVLGC